MIKRIACFFYTVAVSVSVNAQVSKAPAYPLITHDPYFSIWSFTDNLNESGTKHWTGRDHSLIGLIKVDGRVYSFLGAPETPSYTILSSGESKPYECRYTENEPDGEWMKEEYNDGAWQTGKLHSGQDGMIVLLQNGSQSQSGCAVCLI